MQTQDPPLAGGRAVASQYPAPATAWYSVGILTLLYILSIVDRQVMALMLDPIKHDLAITDTQASLLYGFAFSLLFCAVSLPVGYFVDRYSRRVIIAIGVFFWSLAATSSGLAQSFGQLFAARVGVGVGEASLSPAAYSIMADSFPPERRALAFGFHAMGGLFAIGLAFIVGGLAVFFVNPEGNYVWPIVGDVRGWQVVFLVTGLPGIFACLLVFTFKEPKRLGTIRAADSKAGVPIAEVIAFLRRDRSTFILFFLGFSMLALLANVMVAWMPSTAIRRHGVSSGEFGITMGLMIAILAPMGQYVASRWIDRLTGRAVLDAPIRVALTLALLLLPVSIAAPLMPNAAAMWAALVPIAFFFMAWVGTATAALTLVVPNEMRGQISALYLFIGMIIGHTLGPLIVALLTDFVFGNPDDVRYSVAIIAGAAATIAALCFYFLLPFFRRNRHAALAWDA